ncbi:MAG: hypothetical protein II816_03820 [Elusimicrobia bacterium]|nr:hypothetical protein [Elusimicrobiota bacterium]
MKICKDAVQYGSDCGKTICCCECPEFGTCKTACEFAPADCGNLVTEETALETFQNTNLAAIQRVTKILVLKKKLDEQEAELRKALVEGMEKYGIKFFESDKLKITFKDAYQKSGVDTKKLKADYPDVYQACYKPSNVKASVVVSLKDG